MRLAAAGMGGLFLVTAELALGPAPVTRAEGLHGSMAARSKIAWGESMQGLRLSLSTDRRVYRTGKDLVTITFTLQNTTRQLYPITLELTGEQRTALTVTDDRGQHYSIAGTVSARMATRMWETSIRPGRVARVTMLLDPAAVGTGLKAGRYRLRGTFRYAGPRMASWVPQEFTVESNEVSFTLRDWREAADGPWPAGEPAGGCSLTLLPERRVWKPGDAPIPFAVVVNRQRRGPDTFRLLSVVGLTYHHLEITAPDGRTLVVPQTAALPSSVSPHFRFAEVPEGRSAGERLAWDPAGPPRTRTLDLDEVIPASGPPAPAPGRYRVRAVYQVDAAAEARYAYGITPDRLESNAVEVEIRRPAPR